MIFTIRKGGSEAQKSISRSKLKKKKIKIKEKRKIICQTV